MNLVWCDQACKFQKDGCCHLKSTTATISFKNNSCCYFQPINENSAKQIQKAAPKNPYSSGKNKKEPGSY